MINVRVYGDQCEGVISDPISRAFKRLGVCPTGTCGRGLTESSELLKLSLCQEHFHSTIISKCKCLGVLASHVLGPQIWKLPDLMHLSTTYYTSFQV